MLPSTLELFTIGPSPATLSSAAPDTPALVETTFFANSNRSRCWPSSHTAAANESA
ncbi:MAG: hypothetical protein JW751_12185 [Polyangiaceae bacterium]|nr:hypothetical protein [Polyangiaceae bacterium]